MALADLAWYVNAGDQSTTGHYAAAQWAAGTPYACGAIIRQKTAPAVNSERCYVCYFSVSGTGQSAAVTEPTFPTTRGGQVTDNNVRWQEITGIPALNSDLAAASMPTWATIKNTVVTLGSVIVSGDGTKVLLCTTAGTSGNGAEPTWAAYSAAGASGATGNTTDNTVTWTTIGTSAAGGHNFAVGAAPHARIQNALTATWYRAGNTVYVADNSAESQATAITWNAANTQPSIGAVLCYDHTIASLPPATGNINTGATVSTSSTVNININGGNLYYYGLTLKAGNGASTSTAGIVLNPAAGAQIVFDNCQFWLADTNANNASQIQIGASSSTGGVSVLWNNCTVKFATTANVITPGTGIWRWQNTGTILVSGSSVPTNLINYGVTIVSGHYQTVFEALDLSQLTGSLNNFNVANHIGFLLVKDCKLNGSMTVALPTVPEFNVQLLSSDSSGTAYKSARYQGGATESTETSITRVGGAQDPAAQQQTRKIVSTANVSWLLPYRAEPFAIWNSVTGASVTVSVYGTINAGAVPNIDDIWIEVEYLGTASFPLGVFATSTKANFLASSSAVSSDGSSWNGGGSGVGWSPFVLQVLLDTTHNPKPQFAGLIWVRVRVGKASTTYYIDPKIVLS